MMLELPYTARNELRGLLRRYQRLAGGMCCSERQAAADFLRLARFTAEGYAAATTSLSPPLGEDAQRDALFARLRRVRSDPDGSVAAAVEHLCAVAGLRFTDAGGALVRAREPVLLKHNSAAVAAEMREVFAGERFGYDWSQQNPNVWSCFGQPSPRSAAWRVRHLLRAIYPLGALCRVYEHSSGDAIDVLAALLRQEEPGARVVLSEAAARERALRWVDLFGSRGLRILTSTPDPAEPLRGSFSARGIVSRAAAVVILSPDRIGLLMRMWGGMAD